jgi:hypothetical protein
MKNIVLLFVLIFSAPSFSLTYTTPMDLRGKVNRWNLDESNDSLCYRVAAEDESDYYYFLEIIDHAAQLWSGVPETNIQLIPCYDNEQILITLHRTLTKEPYASGYAEFDQIDANNLPLHCSMHIKVDLSYSVRGIAKTILHEMGHCLGLEHSLIPQAIMSYHSEQNRFALDLDDRAAIGRLYPLDNEAMKLPVGCGIGADSSLPFSLPPGSKLAIVIILLLPLGISVLKKTLTFWHEN